MHTGPVVLIDQNEDYLSIFPDNISRFLNKLCGGEVPWKTYLSPKDFEEALATGFVAKPAVVIINASFSTGNLDGVPIALRYATNHATKLPVVILRGSSSPDMDASTNKRLEEAGIKVFLKTQVFGSLVLYEKFAEHLWRIGFMAPPLIIVVEDDAVFRQFLMDMLTTLSCTVVGFASLNVAKLDPRYVEANLYILDGNIDGALKRDGFIEAVRLATQGKPVIQVSNETPGKVEYNMTRGYPYNYVDKTSVLKKLLPLIRATLNLP